MLLQADNKKQDVPAAPVTSDAVLGVLAAPDRHLPAVSAVRAAFGLTGPQARAAIGRAVVDHPDHPEAQRVARLKEVAHRNLSRRTPAPWKEADEVDAVVEAFYAEP